jgi:3-hydroxyisobutyrate dehydrogenase-like beta-hydroxyacid dehydrogenase
MSPGFREDFEEFRSLLDALCDEVHHAGPAGAGISCSPPTQRLATAATRMLVVSRGKMANKSPPCGNY